MAFVARRHGEHRDPHLAGRSLVSKAAALIESGDPDAAIQALKQADGLIDPKREPRLLLCLRHNLADNLSKAGRYREAATLLPDLKELAAAHGSALDRLRLDWVEARVATGLGDHARAQTLLVAIRRTFLAEGNPFDAALAALDLSISFLEEGRTSEVRELAEEMVTVFRELNVAREPLAALLLFQEAARRETASLPHQGPGEEPIRPPPPARTPAVPGVGSPAARDPGLAVLPRYAESRLPLP